MALSHGVTSGDRPIRGRTTGVRDTVQRAAHTVAMPVRLHHIVVDAHDLPGLIRFWTQALGFVQGGWTAGRGPLSGENRPSTT